MHLIRSLIVALIMPIGVAIMLGLVAIFYGGINTEHLNYILFLGGALYLIMFVFLLLRGPTGGKKPPHE